MNVHTVVPSLLLAGAVVALTAVVALAAVRRELLCSCRGQLVTVLAVSATVGSLTLSEGLGYTPCEMCWWQRAAMYPLAVGIFWGSYVRLYTAGAAAVGLGIASWHWAVQHLDAFAESSSCSAAAPCSATWVDIGGFASIPFMAGLMFAAILVVAAVPAPNVTER